MAYSSTARIALAPAGSTTTVAPCFLCCRAQTRPSHAVCHIYLALLSVFHLRPNPPCAAQLTIVRSDDGGSADEAFVTFRASYVERKAKGGDGKSLQMGTLWKEAAVNRTLSQKSRFVRDGGAGAWRYVSSVDLSPNTVGKY